MQNFQCFRISLRSICFGSVIAMIAFCLLTYSWPFIPGQVEFSDNSTDSDAGCNVTRHSWCKHLSPVNPYLYYAVYILIVGIAFPALNVAIITLYSQILGPRRQGTLQGIFQISGGTARMLGPFVLGNLYAHFGPRMTWNVEIGVLGITVTVWVIFYRKMVPLQMDPDRMSRTEIHPKLSNPEVMTSKGFKDSQ